ALETLSERKRNIVLLSYFLDMSDEEIGQLLNVVRTTVFRHRKAALAKIKQYMEGKADENMILSILVDTFFSRISLSMPPIPKSHNTACVLSWEEVRHWQSRSSGYSSS